MRGVLRAVHAGRAGCTARGRMRGADVACTALMQWMHVVCTCVPEGKLRAHGGALIRVRSKIEQGLMRFWVSLG